MKRISRAKIYLLRVAANFFFALSHSAADLFLSLLCGGAAILAVHEWHELCFAITNVDGEIWVRELGVGVGGMRRLKFSRPYRARKRTFDHRRRFICDAVETGAAAAERAPATKVV